MDMKRTLPERKIVVVLFILVLVVFSFAERDSRKLDQLYSAEASKPEPVKELRLAGTGAVTQQSAFLRARN